MRILHKENKGWLQQDDEGHLFITNKRGKLYDLKNSKKFLRRPHIINKLEQEFGQPIQIKFFIEKPKKRRGIW